MSSRRKRRGAKDFSDEDREQASWLYGKEGIFQPYPPGFCAYLEVARANATSTKETATFLDADGNSWIVDVSTMTHTHSETGETYLIKRVENERTMPEYKGDAGLWRPETSEAWTAHDVARMMTEMQAEMDRLSNTQNSDTVIWSYVQHGKHIAYPEDFCNVLEVILHTPSTTNKQTPYISENGSTAMVDLSSWTHTFMDTYEVCQIKRRFKQMERDRSSSLRVMMTPSFSRSSYLSESEDRELWHPDEYDEPSKEMRKEIRKLSNLFTPPDKEMLASLGVQRQSSYTANMDMTPDLQDSFLKVAGAINEFSISKSHSLYEEEIGAVSRKRDMNLVREGDFVKQRDAKRLGDEIQAQIERLELENKAKSGKSVWTYVRDGTEIFYPESFATILEVIYIQESTSEEKRSPYIEPDSQDTCIIDLSLMIHRNLVTGECWPVRRQRVQTKKLASKSTWSVAGLFGFGKKLKTSEIETNMQQEYEQAIATENRQKYNLRSGD